MIPFLLQFITQEVFFYTKTQFHSVLLSKIHYVKYSHIDTYCRQFPFSFSVDLCYTVKMNKEHKTGLSINDKTAYFSNI